MSLKFDGLRILVAGDAMIDTYHWGRVDRVSPEAPVPIFIEDYDRCETRRGGSDNCAHQLEAWGCEVGTLFAKRRSVKHRYFAGHHQVFRRDSDSKEVWVPTEVALMGYDAVVLSDYAKGFLSPNLCQYLISQANRLGIPVIVDPKGSNWDKYAGCTVICPNEKEYAGNLSCAVVHKLGANGIDLTEDGETTHYPARSVPVFDVTGAGDTVCAAIAATLGAGEGLKVACQIAVYAASVVVQKVGTSICTKEELCALDSPTGFLTAVTKDIGTSSPWQESCATTSLSRSTMTRPLRFSKDLTDLLGLSSDE